MDGKLQIDGGGGCSSPLKEEAFELRPPWSQGRGQRRFGKENAPSSSDSKRLGLGTEMSPVF